MWGFINQWVFNNYMELSGFIAGVVYIFLSIKQNILLWPVGIITSAAYMLVFFKSTLYADMGLQIYYLIISFYGWYHWLKGKNINQNSNQIKIITVTKRQWVGIILSTFILTCILYFPMKKFTNASNPLWDGFVSAGSIVATWMLSQKMIEQWIMWIIIDVMSMVLFIYKNLYLTVILFLIYSILAIIGFIKWKQVLAIQNQ